MKTILAILLLTVLAGCTTTRWERVDELGAVLKGRQDTFCAKTDASAINAVAEGDKDGYKMNIGSTAEAADSTDALKSIEVLIELVRALAPLFVPAAAPVAITPAPGG